MTTPQEGSLFRPIPPAFGIVLALAIFVIDTVTTLDMAIAVLYVVVVLLAANAMQRRSVVLVAAMCMLATVVSFLVSHGTTVDTALARCLVSLAAIAITAVLALKNQSVSLALHEQAHLLDLTHDTIFARNMKNAITYWNRGAEQLYGWSAEEVLGKVVHDLFQTVFPVPLDQITAELLRTERWEGELIHTKRDGSTVVVASRWSLQKDASGAPVAILETNNDISERKQAENALRRSKAYLAEAQRLSHTGSFAWRPGTGEIFWSNECYRIFGYRNTVKPTLEIIRSRIHPADVDLVNDILTRVQRDLADWTAEHRLLMPDGSVKYLQVVARLSRTDAGTDEYVGALQDVTAVRMAEFALSETQAALAHVNRVTTLEALTASIAHEINQPLAAMVTSASAGVRWLAAQPPDLAEVRRSLERIAKDGERAGAIISRIRALVQRAPVRTEEVNINDIIQESLALARTEIQRHGIILRTRLAAEPPLLHGDHVQLQQVSLNLIVNAIEAMGRLNASGGELEIETGLLDRENLVVTVRDSGPGLDQEQLDLVFDAFYTTKPNGTGLGLAICRKIIEVHGGRMWASVRKHGAGAEFHFTLPLERPGSGA